MHDVGPSLQRNPGAARVRPIAATMREAGSGKYRVLHPFSRGSFRKARAKNIQSVRPISVIHSGRSCSALQLVGIGWRNASEGVSRNIRLSGHCNGGARTPIFPGGNRLQVCPLPLDSASYRYLRPLAVIHSDSCHGGKRTFVRVQAEQRSTTLLQSFFNVLESGHSYRAAPAVGCATPDQGKVAGVDGMITPVCRE